MISGLVEGVLSFAGVDVAAVLNELSLPGCCVGVVEAVVGLLLAVVASIAGDVLVAVLSLSGSGNGGAGWLPVVMV